MGIVMFGEIAIIFAVKNKVHKKKLGDLQIPAVLAQFCDLPMADAI